jgi:NAD-dependent deacetylase
MKKIVILTGAGMSAESGLLTFRDGDGLWNNYRIEDVATYEAWQHNMELVMDFYNQRRKQLYEVEPNLAHFELVKLEEKYDVHIISQNVDNLHERAGSSNVLHLHGELTKARSSVDDTLVYDIKGWELKIGETCEKGSQLRPHIVWFGEAVPLMQEAIAITQEADIFIVIGTSLLVYPAASLLYYVSDDVPLYYIDPKTADIKHRNVNMYIEKATKAVPKLVKELLLKV